MPIFKDYVVVDVRAERGFKHIVYLTHINEDEEKIIDSGDSLIIKRNNKKFNLRLSSNILCYGEVDFSKGSDDLKEIATFTFLDYLGAVGVRIPSDYDYENHCCHSPLKRYRYTETFKPDVLVRYKHGCLNKPKRIALFITKCAI